MLAAIRRGLRRGALPEDQAEMLRGRLARQLVTVPHVGRIVTRGMLPGAIRMTAAADPTFAEVRSRAWYMLAESNTFVDNKDVMFAGAVSRAGFLDCSILPRDADVAQPIEVTDDLVQPRIGVRRLVQSGNDSFDKLAGQPYHALIFGLNTGCSLQHKPRDVDG